MMLGLQVRLPGVWAGAQELHRHEVCPVRGQGGPRLRGAQVQVNQDRQHAGEAVL